ncbi:NUDIX domain-containing protein [Pseudofrankia sp. BMG5.37]|uniref:NUDIX hydrolase n=1 Tax=Pseudofrankia sp. BMG5.37 TaxID=3050035 RepID=UPI002895FDED|nr:NUDIX domain-containing protein [Pseudofrankia sp. BMG5.37]MDT3438369.1 NUDIX domain-containing protein [Pseudofrankia sp. BMG5.37]
MTAAGSPAADEDRRPTVRSRPGRGPTRLTCLGREARPAFEAVTSASVVAVDDDGRLVLAELARGLDLPGGHVQWRDTSPEETARREALEEIRAELGELTLVEVIESDYFGPDDLTYMIIYVARVHRLLPWTGGHESAGRVLLPPAGFLAGYRGTRPGLMRHLVTSALAALSAG